MGVYVSAIRALTVAGVFRDVEGEKKCIISTRERMFQLETLVTTSLTSLLPAGIRPKDLVYSPGKLNLVVHACNPGLGRLRPEDQPKFQGILGDIKKKKKTVSKTKWTKNRPQSFAVL